MKCERIYQLEDWKNEFNEDIPDGCLISEELKIARCASGNLIKLNEETYGWRVMDSNKTYHYYSQLHKEGKYWRNEGRYFK